MREKRADLHVHTIYSDGSLSPEEAIKYAKSVNLDCIAIADHDSTNGIEEGIRSGQKLGVEVIPAVEISAEEDSVEVHMLGYFIDYKDEKLISVLRQIREDRKKRALKMIDALNSHGLNIDVDDFFNSIGDVSVSRLHIARYLENKQIVSSWRDAFRKYIGDDKSCYISSFRLSSQQAIDLIKEVKGIPVIAHPGLYKINRLLPKLIEQGIKGIEVFHSEHSDSDSRHYEALAKEKGLLITGGSDCHGTFKGKILMNTVVVPYSYVEALKTYAASKG